MKKGLIFLLLGAIIVAGVFIFIRTNPALFESVKDRAAELVPDATPALSVSGHDLKVGSESIIYVEELNPIFKISRVSESARLSLDGSLNVLNDDFYGTTVVKNGEFLFTPSFVLTPGKHNISVRDGELEYTFDFVIAYHETFSKPLDENRMWVVPNTSSPEWFSVETGKLSISPKQDLSYSSLAFVYKLKSNFVIDFEFSPKGERIGAVPYVINTVRNEFVLGSNSDDRNVLFHSDSEGRRQIEGETSLWEKGKRYQIRIERHEGHIKVGAVVLEEGKQVNPSLQTSDLRSIFVFDDSANEGAHPYYFGISAWEKADGFTIDDVYITSL